MGGWGTLNEVESWQSLKPSLEEELMRRLAAMPGVVGEAMRYSALGGGKRIRGLLFLNLVDALGRDPHPFLPFASGIECIHTYSLIHDDLPAMDDDDLRRGRPTCHRVFGEAQAILAGDGLLTEGLRLLLADEVVAAAGEKPALLAFHAVARAVGPLGMVLGQSLDILGTASKALVEEIHALKTASFFRGIAEAAAHLAGGDVRSLAHFGEAFGMAFQIMDDLLDRRATTEALGKTAGKDEAQEKVTYASVYGEVRAEAELARFLEEAEDEARRLPRPGQVVDLIRWARVRQA